MPVPTSLLTFLSYGTTRAHLRVAHMAARLLLPVLAAAWALVPTPLRSSILYRLGPSRAIDITGGLRVHLCPTLDSSSQSPEAYTWSNASYEKVAVTRAP